MPLPAHACIQPAFTYDPQPPSSMPPMTSRQDTRLYSTSDVGCSQLSFSYSHMKERATDDSTYDTGFLSPAVLGDVGSEPNGMLDNSWNEVHYPSVLEHGCDTMNEDISSFSGLEFPGSEVGWPTYTEAHVDATLDSCSTDRLTSHQSSPLYLSPGDLSYLELDSFYFESSACNWLPVSSVQGEQNVQDLYLNSIRPIPQLDGQASIFPSWENSQPGGFEDNLNYLGLSENWRLRNYTSEARPEVEAFESKNVAEPISEKTGSAGLTSKIECSRCLKTFTYSADLNRHTKTQHGPARTGYRCAFPRCSKVHKVWSRLDSFKKHVKNQHDIQDDDINGWVKKSATGNHGLPMSVTSLSSSRAEPSVSRTQQSVSL